MNRAFLPLLQETGGAHPVAKPEGSIYSSSSLADQSIFANHPRASASTVAPTPNTCAQDAPKSCLTNERHGAQKPESITTHPGKTHHCEPFRTHCTPDNNPGPAPGSNQPGSSANDIGQINNPSSSSRSNEEKARSERRVRSRVAQMGNEMYFGTRYRQPGWYHTLCQMPTLSRNTSEERDEGPFPDVQTANDAAWQATKQLMDVDPRHELSYKTYGPDGQMRFLGASREKFISCRVWKQDEGSKDTAVEGLTEEEHKSVSEIVWTAIT